MQIKTETGSIYRPGNFEITNKAISFCKFKNGAKILDVGCGSGATVQYLSQNYNFEVFGIDKFSDFAKEQTNLSNAAGEQIPFAPANFDAVLMECSFTVMENQTDVLNECTRVLKPDGFLIISGIYARGEEEKLLGCMGLIEKKDSLVQKVENHGFAIKHYEDFTHSLQTYWGQLIFDHGAKAFYCNLGVNPEVLKRVKCGYFLLIAQKGKQ